MTYAPSPFWDFFYQRLRQAESDLNSEGRWAASWISVLDHSGYTRVLDLGCGTGGDCLVLARRGLDVTGIDYSHEAATEGAGESSRGKPVCGFSSSRYDSGSPISSWSV